MSDSPDTRPGELSRLAGGDEYRLFMLEKMIAVSEEASANKAWRSAHDASDKLQFAAIHSEIADLKLKTGAVSSNVGSLQDDRAQIKGAWKALGIVVAVGTVIAGLLSWAWEHLVSLFRAPP